METRESEGVIGPRGRRLFLILAFALLLSPCLGYTGVYAFARATHRLVNYGSFIARPHATRGIGISTWELVFLPLTELEGGVRNAFDDMRRL